MYKFGFIGVGNMGGAIAMAVAKAIDPNEILVCGKGKSRAASFAESYGVVASDMQTIAKEAKFVVLGVKPQYMEEVLTAIAPILANRTGFILVTMAAGLTMENIATMAGGNYPVIRIMPNTPARVGEGVVQFCVNPLVSAGDLQEFLAAMKPAGLLDELPENLIDAGSAVAGCGPAFACMFMEALADGGVACGLPRAKALEYAAQMVLGTAQLLLSTGEHPGVLKDQVCSPGGSTIQGVRALEVGGLRGTVMEAVIAAFEKNKEFIR